jgi:DNA-binding NarL/FixJ family response regulator
VTLRHGGTGRDAGLAVAGAAVGPDPVEARPAALTPREVEIAGLIAAGLSTRRIAAVLAVSGRTVEWHVCRILRKLGLESRVQIAVWAVHNGEGSPRLPE